jgi:hypothetical protein
MESSPITAKKIVSLLQRNIVQRNNVSIFLDITNDLFPFLFGKIFFPTNTLETDFPGVIQDTGIDPGFAFPVPPPVLQTDGTLANQLLDFNRNHGDFP